MLNHHRGMIGKTKGPEAELNLKLQFEKYKQIIGLNKRIKVTRKSPVSKAIATNQTPRVATKSSQRNHLFKMDPLLIEVSPRLETIPDGIIN